jgi:nitronate monooxygenase
MVDTSETIHYIKSRLRIPAFAAPMFLVSGPELVIAACKAGVIGALPTLNARPVAMLREWLETIQKALREADHDAPGKVAPWAANLIVHRSNKRFDADFELIREFRPEIVITALGSPARVIEGVHHYGGLVFADVNSVEFAQKAAERGADGLVLVCAGAGGHTGFMPAPEFIGAVREFFAGPIAAGGAISTGADIATVIDAGADFAYMGTRFIATAESRASDDYKDMIVSAGADDIVLTPHFTGVPAHFLRPSIVAAGIDPAMLDQPKEKIDFSELEHAGAAWKDIWSAGKGVAAIDSVLPVAELVDDLAAEFRS